MIWIRELEVINIMHRVWNMCCFGRKKPFNIKRALIWNRRYNNVAWCEIKWNAASLGIYQIYDILYRIDVLYKTVALEYRGEKYMNNSIKSRKITCFYPNMLWPFLKLQTMELWLRGTSMNLLLWIEFLLLYFPLVC